MHGFCRSCSTIEGCPLISARSYGALSSVLDLKTARAGARLWTRRLWTRLWPLNCRRSRAMSTSGTGVCERFFPEFREFPVPKYKYDAKWETYHIAQAATLPRLRNDPPPHDEVAREINLDEIVEQSDLDIFRRHSVAVVLESLVSRVCDEVARAGTAFVDRGGWHPAMVGEL
eukprot:SAG31_NODE_17605_length_664_cov_53.339823_1_plen_172_part_10